MQDLIPIVLPFCPDIAKWLSGDTADIVNSSIVASIQSITGSEELPTAISLSTLLVNVEKSAELRILLAKIVRDQEELSAQDNLNNIKKILSNITPGSSYTEDSKIKLISVVPLLSVIILSIFSLSLWYVLTHPNIGNFASGMVGTLCTMAITVVAYWFGSSLGSTRKSDMIQHMANNPVVVGNNTIDPSQITSQTIGRRAVKP